MPSLPFIPPWGEGIRGGGSGFLIPKDRSSCLRHTKDTMMTSASMFYHTSPTSQQQQQQQLLLLLLLLLLLRQQQQQQHTTLSALTEGFIESFSTYKHSMCDVTRKTKQLSGSRVDMNRIPVA